MKTTPSISLAKREGSMTIRKMIDILSMFDPNKEVAIENHDYEEGTTLYEPTSIHLSDTGLSVVIKTE